MILHGKLSIKKILKFPKFINFDAKRKQKNKTKRVCHETWQNDTKINWRSRIIGTAGFIIMLWELNCCGIPHR